MRYLNRFDEYLREYDRIFPVPKLEKSIRYMEATAKQIEDKLKDSAMGEPNPELVRQTIEKFFRWELKPLSEEFNWLEVALLCHGLLVEIPSYCRLMDSKTAIQVLLNKFSVKYQSQMLSAYPWQGLFNAYLNVSPRHNPKIEESWLELRAFLQQTLDKVAGHSNHKPRWLDALIEHRIVLTENATRSLAEEALQGRMDKVDRIAREINIPPTSWFWPELLMSQVEAIINYPDDKFKSAIDHVLPQLQQRTECLDDGLARILDRYSRCTNIEPHQEIKSASVSRWHSPTLEKQRNWERVTQEAKQMVQRWLVVEDLRDFFLKLRQTSDDDSLDRRRFEFWMQYLDQISYSFLILGPDTRANFKQLLAEKIGRHSALTGTNRSNNAFLIRIGENYIVEFGGVGKTWAYSESKIRPLLNYDSVRYDNLRSHYGSLFNGYLEASDGGLTHQGAWEVKFNRALDYLGIIPDIMTLDEFLDRYQITKEKFPSGTFRVRHFYNDGTVADFLRRQGFWFKSRAEGFYLNPRNAAKY